MVLTGVRGSYKAVNMALLLHSFDQPSCLLLDCSNCANPHKLFPHVGDEKFRNVYVIEIEMIYKFRDVLKRALDMVKMLKATCLVITTFRGLFNYDNEEENRAVYEHAWELMKGISKHYPVFVGVEQDSRQEEFAAKFCDEIYDLVV